jgi:hypothetical protein
VAGLIWLWNQGSAAADPAVHIAADISTQAAWWFEDEDTGEIARAAAETTAVVLDAVPAVLVGPPAPDVVQAAQDYTDEYPHGHDPEDAWWGNVFGFPDQALDVVPTLFPPAAPGEPIETFASQPHYGEAFFESDVDYWDTSRASTTFFIPAVEIAIAADTAHLDAYYQVDEEHLDHAVTTLDVTPQLFPPFVQEPDSTFAAQPHYGDLFETYVPEETQDYAFAEQLEFLAPPEAPIAELEAAQPHYGELPIPADETEDYANDSTLDTTPTLFPAGVEPVETFAAQPLAEQPWFEGEIVEDYQAAPEQLEFLAPPEVPTTELLASQPHFGEAFWPDQDTEDYQADSTLDLTPSLFPTAEEAIEVFAAQPHYGEWWWDEQATEDYAADTTVDVTPHLVAGVEPIETLAAAGYTAYQDHEPAETLEDYQHTTTLDVAPLTFAPPATIVEIVPSYTTFHDLVDLLTPDSLEDYQHTSTLDDVAPFAAPPPAPVYLTEGDADAAVGMQSDGGMGDALEHDADANAGAESDDGKGDSIEGGASPITGLES